MIILRKNVINYYMYISSFHRRCHVRMFKDKRKHFYKIHRFRFGKFHPSPISKDKTEQENNKQFAVWQPRPEVFVEDISEKHKI